MLVYFTQFAKKLWSRLASATKQLFRHLTQLPQLKAITGGPADLPRSRAELLAENALLRQQLNILHRQVKTPRLTWRDRSSLLLLAHWVLN